MVPAEGRGRSLASLWILLQQTSGAHPVGTGWLPCLQEPLCEPTVLSHYYSGSMLSRLRNYTHFSLGKLIGCLLVFVF